jgi:ribosomal protein L40E
MLTTQRGWGREACWRRGHQVLVLIVILTFVVQSWALEEEAEEEADAPQAPKVRVVCPRCYRQELSGAEAGRRCRGTALRPHLPADMQMLR